MAELLGKVFHFHCRNNSDRYGSGDDSYNLQSGASSPFRNGWLPLICLARIFSPSLGVICTVILVLVALLIFRLLIPKREKLLYHTEQGDIRVSLIRCSLWLKKLCGF